MFSLTPLPYDLDALEPHISRETLEYHHGKHLQTYVDNLNKLTPETEFINLSLEEIIRKAPPGGVFNNAAQVYNHVFYFESLGSVANHIPSKGLYDAINARWGSIDTFRAEFTRMALANFGSGWTWLVKKPDGSLDIVNTANAETQLRTEENASQNSPAPGLVIPIKKELVPLLTCDVWEHAYYIDYRNARAKYMENFWKVVNWKKVSERYGI